MEKLYTIAELSTRLGVAESTLRRYANRHAEYVPSRGVGRKRRYLLGSLEVFTRIADLYAQNYTYEQVTDILRSEYPTVIEAVATTTTQPPQDTNELKTIIKLMSEKIIELENTVAVLKKSQDETREEQSLNHQTVIQRFDQIEEAYRRDKEVVEKARKALGDNEQKKLKKRWQFWK